MLRGRWIVGVLLVSIFAFQMKMTTIGIVHADYVQTFTPPIKSSQVTPNVRIELHP
jgi:hypothetical protein